MQEEPGRIVRVECPAVDPHAGIHGENGAQAVLLRQQFPVEGQVRIHLRYIFRNIQLRDPVCECASFVCILLKPEPEGPFCRSAVAEMLDHRHGLCRARSRLKGEFQFHPQQLVQALFMEGEIIVQAAVCAAKESRACFAKPQVRLADRYLDADGALKLFRQVLRQEVNPVYPVQQRRIPSGRIPGKIRLP